MEIVRSLGERQSQQGVVDVFRGSLNAQIKRYGHHTHPLHGAGREWGKGDVERMLHRLVLDRVLQEDVSKSDVYGTVSTVIRVDERGARRLMADQHKVILK